MLSTGSEILATVQPRNAISNNVFAPSHLWIWRASDKSTFLSFHPSKYPQTTP